MSKFKTFLRAFIPYGLVVIRRRKLYGSANSERVIKRERFHSERRRAIEQANVGDPRVGPRFLKLDATNREAVVEFLAQRGIPRFHITEGSIPDKSLEFVADQIQTSIVRSGPLLAVHVGNFVGVSLAFLSATLKRLDHQALTIGIDPNLTHRDVANPQEHVAALLCACDLQENTMLVAGYSGSKSVSNDGVTFGAYNPVNAFAEESGCERTLRNLRPYLTGRCQVAMLDGNHEADYLASELTEILPLMQKGGLVVLDDVDENWSEIRAVFDRVQNFGLEAVATDGRVGIARVL